MAIGTTNERGAFRLSTERKLIKPEWWIDKTLLKNSVTMLSAQPKAGKSAFAAHLAYATATGTKFFERDVPKGEVLFISGERAQQTEDRLLELAGAGGAGLENIVLCDTEDDRFNFKFVFNTEPGTVDENVAFIRDDLGCNPSLIIIDTLTSFMVGNINEPEPMKEFFDGVRRVTRAFNAATIVIHHDNKTYDDGYGKRSGGGSFNGSIQALAKCDSWIRAKVIKEVADADDPYGQGKIKMTKFSLVEDNFGGAFTYTVAVKKLLEQPNLYLDQADLVRMKQREAMLDVLKKNPQISENRWIAMTKDAYPEFESNLGNRTFSTLREALMTDELVYSIPNPQREGWLLFVATED
jgi:hypothetical protein